MITLRRLTPELDEQISYLIRRELYVTYYFYRKIPFFLFGATLLILGIAFFTPGDRLVTFKAVSLVMLVVGWIAALVFFATVLVKRYRRNSWKRKAIKSYSESDPAFRFGFDDQKLYFEGDTFKADLTWEYFGYYAVNKNSIFLLREPDLYNSLYYSVNELGAEMYGRLVAMAEKKLKPVELP